MKKSPKIIISVTQCVHVCRKMMSIKHFCIYSLSLFCSLVIGLAIVIPCAAMLGTICSEIGKFAIKMCGPYGFYYFVLFRAVILRKHPSFMRLFAYTRETVQSIATVVMYVAIVICAKNYGINPDISLHSIAIVFSGMFCECIPSALKKAMATVNDHLNRCEPAEPAAEGEPTTEGEPAAPIVIEANNHHHIE